MSQEASSRTAETPDRLRELEDRLGIRFAKRDILARALVHSSALRDQGRGQCNEQLEFLGDAVLQFIVTEELYGRYPDAPEGQMTRSRASVVSGRHLARKAEALGLGECIRMGRGAVRSGGRRQPSILADTMEALIAAIYLDQGIETARTFVLRMLQEDIAQAMERKGVPDAKSMLQELLQTDGPVRIAYETTGEQGPPHDRTFTVTLFVGDHPVSTASGKSKKQAEQNAANIALKKLKNSAD
ncbi:MAG: ribonuclease III [Clostridiales bacterium]|nr:ribonuclease III [Clostridiales bacterium]